MSNISISLQSCAIHRYQAQAINWESAISENDQIEESLYVNGYFQEEATHFVLHLRFRSAGKNTLPLVDDMNDGFIIFACAVAKFDARNATGIERQEFQKTEAMNFVLPTLRKAYDNVFGLLGMSPRYEFPSTLSSEQMDKIMNREEVKITSP